MRCCFQTPSRLFFVIEFVRGGDLMFHMQRQRRLPEEHARFYSAEICLALNFLHDKGALSYYVSTGKGRGDCCMYAAPPIRMFFEVSPQVSEIYSTEQEL